jgi:hypothetical protein
VWAARASDGAAIAFSGSDGFLAVADAKLASAARKLWPSADSCAR